MDKPLVYASSILKLLRGPISLDEDPKAWDQLYGKKEEVRKYFEQIGLILYMDEVDCYAFLRQTSDEDDDDDKEKLPKLTRKIAINRRETLLLVLLREVILEREEKDPSSSAIVRKEDIYELLKPYFPKTTNEVDLYKDFDRMIRAVENLGFIRMMDGSGIKIRKILKAKLSVADLERIKSKFREGGADDESIQSQNE
ncbi:PF13835 domain protein [Leptospira weilii serovar Ranarum str. ICFT]|uniref:PF13835 domain protein n=1 Tax=Leptospira weilii serovar Ranarum str. ICFT TaxID=1218598 RepID=N1WNE9_9LEPT|nr:DUF4194 domain-containing protein [Leptospira weilii]EMY78777.1 PF13835 domain protein [Leptospira weilii serovar Ranarum str. ICFT]